MCRYKLVHVFQMFTAHTHTHITYTEYLLELHAPNECIRWSTPWAGPEKFLVTVGKQRGREEGREEERDRESDVHVKIFSVFKTSKVDACPLNPPPPFFPPSLTLSETESPVFSHGRSPDTFPPPLFPPPPSPPPHLHPAHTHTHTHNNTCNIPMYNKTLEAWWCLCWESEKQIQGKEKSIKKLGSSWDSDPGPSEY